MASPPRSDRRAIRHAAVREGILGAAWRLARERGLGGWALRDLAAEVGMRAPSLYGYFASKNALYDAMFAEGYAELLARIDRHVSAAAERGDPPAEALRAGSVLFVDFCVEEPARHQLLFLRTIPGFVPSERSYAVALDVLDRLRTTLDAAGAGTAEALDLWTAVFTGLATQQVSNDPGGDRWRRLAPAAVEMFLREHRAGAADDQPS